MITVPALNEFVQVAVGVTPANRAIRRKTVLMPNEVGESLEANEVRHCRSMTFAKTSFLKYTFEFNHTPYS